jgi:ABC-type Fe3+ transport system permease subunit
MGRPRLALAAGSVVLVTLCVLGAVVPAVMRPQPPWTDVVTQQRSWARTEDWLFGIAAALLIAGWLLLAYSFVELRSEARRRRIIELSSSHGSASTPTVAATEDG